MNIKVAKKSQQQEVLGATLTRVHSPGQRLSLSNTPHPMNHTATAYIVHVSDRTAPNLDAMLVTQHKVRDTYIRRALSTALQGT